MVQKINSFREAISLLPGIWNSVLSLKKTLAELSQNVDSVRTSLGRIEARQDGAVWQGDAGDLRAHEFKVFSQFGEDGIIQFLIRTIPVSRPVFVEFGVEDYTEANTRFLLVNNCWSGLVLDGSHENITIVKNSSLYWRANLKAVESFVTRENINTLLSENGISGEIGLLSVDIDGNDYWVWESIDSVKPDIVIVEYNPRFGPDLSVSIPYKADFDRTNSGHPIIYYGASLKAFARLAERKGYALVGCNSSGVNAFFVRRDKMVPPLKEISVEEAYRPASYHEVAEDQTPGLTSQLMHCPLVEVP